MTALPIDDVLDAIREALATRGAGILAAPPGAGKTTRVPLALLSESWLGTRKILVLEPRRIAARAAAERMAATLGEPLAKTIGLRARLASRTGPSVRIEVVTEGVFTRMILDDPELSDVGAVLFDEFHERSIDADLGLALALDARSAFRPDLRILIMSATLDVGRISNLLGEEPIIESRGRAFPVETRYAGRTSNWIDDDVANTVLKALRAETGSILAFLPGQGEIVRAADKISANVSDASVDIAPLYGALSPAQQDLAISRPKDGRRKVVLATSIAESSITIEGVRVVIDSGLARAPRFEPDIGVTRLETVRVSRASADQRRGRAGRVEPGVCYRLWLEPETQGLPAHAEPEIKSADLSGLLLDCAEWGAPDARTLTWLDPPSLGALAAAREGLQQIDAVDADGRITAQGRRLRALPLPPRLAHMVLKAADIGASDEAAMIAAVLVERGAGGNDADLERRLESFRRDRSRRADDLRRLAQGWARLAGPSKKGSPDTASTASLLALAFPDRIAKQRGAPGQFLLANGRAGQVDPLHPLAKAPYIVVAELQGRAAATRILLAAAMDDRDVLRFAGARIVESDDIYYDVSARAVRARRTRRLGAIVISSDQRRLRRDEDVAGVLASGVAQTGVDKLPWTKPQEQLRQRAAFLRAAGGDWPDLSDLALSETVDTWLRPLVGGKTEFSEIDPDALAQAMDVLLPWSLRRKLDDEAPTHFEAPTGNRFAVDYEGAGAPAVHLRVQEVFGLKQHPTIAGGRLPLTLNLLSPAHRPIQITRDLPGFWSGSWTAVRADLRGQYPKHFWPEDPANAAPTARAKPRGT